MTIVPNLILLLTFYDVFKIGYASDEPSLCNRLLEKQNDNKDTHLNMSLYEDFPTKDTIHDIVEDQYPPIEKVTKDIPNLTDQHNDNGIFRKQTKILNVKPGRLGIEVKEFPRAGVIAKLKSDVQFCFRDISVGWKIDKINDKPYSPELLIKMTRGAHKYELKCIYKLIPLPIHFYARIFQYLNPEELKKSCMVCKDFYEAINSEYFENEISHKMQFKQIEDFLEPIYHTEEKEKIGDFEMRFYTRHFFKNLKFERKNFFHSFSLKFIDLENEDSSIEILFNPSLDKKIMFQIQNGEKKCLDYDHFNRVLESKKYPLSVFFGGVFPRRKVSLTYQIEKNFKTIYKQSKKDLCPKKSLEICCYFTVANLTILIILAIAMGFICLGDYPAPCFRDSE